MAYSTWGPVEFLIIGISLVASVIGVVGVIFLKTTSGTRKRRIITPEVGIFSRDKKVAEAAIDELCSKISLLENKQRVLGVYTAEYFSTMHEAGWEDLHGMIENLRTIETSLRVMWDQRQYQKVLDICDYMFGRCHDRLAQQIADTYEGLAPLANWQEESRIFSRIMKNTCRLISCQVRLIN
jgi:hypothetical protein